MANADDAQFLAEDFFEMALDNACVAGLDGYFKRLNPSWTRTLGWTPEELKSRPSIEFVHPDDRETVLANRQRLREGLPMGPLVNRYRCRDGTYRWLEWRSVANPERGLVYAVARDITEQKEAEERLREAKAFQEKLQGQLIFADRMASVGTLAAGVAHEINNPLAYVTVNVKLILERLQGLEESPDPVRLGELREMAREAETGVERIRRIVQGLRTFSRAEKERRSLVDVRPLLELSLNMTFNEFRHRARLVKSFGAVPLVEADDARLGQVFINLLINAAQALPARDPGTNEIRIGTSTDAEGRAVIEVSDTGAGIPPHVIGRIFDPFFTTKPVGVGTGLGLFVCHSIVSGLGGELTVASEEGRGTTFRIVLPAAPSRAPEATPPPLASPRIATRASVLVIDDEASIGVALRRVLGDHDVTAVTSAREALEILGNGGRFDLIFTDVMMPGMSGIDLHDELSRRFPETLSSVVFISGGAFTPEAKAFLERVPNRPLEKPFAPEAVRGIVERILRERQGGGGR